jgi:hypothetical protein
MSPATMDRLRLQGFSCLVPPWQSIARILDAWTGHAKSADRDFPITASPR